MRKSFGSALQDFHSFINAEYRNGCLMTIYIYKKCQNHKISRQKHKNTWNRIPSINIRTYARTSTLVVIITIGLQFFLTSVTLLK